MAQPLIPEEAALLAIFREKCGLARRAGGGQAPGQFLQEPVPLRIGAGVEPAAGDLREVGLEVVERQEDGLGRKDVAARTRSG